MTAVVSGLATIRADVLVLASFDYDHDRAALRALRDAIARAGGPDYPHLFTALPNTGMPTGLDLDDDGRLGGPGDAQGYGRFAGQGGLAILSRHPLTLIEDHSARLWRDVPDSLLVDAQGRVGAQATGADIQRLSTTAHWEVGMQPPTGPELRIMTFHATPPVFDGPEDRNGRRNHDEVLFWAHRLDGRIGTAPAGPFVIMGAANLPPDGGDGRTEAICRLLAHPRVQDAPDLHGKPTVNWPDPGPGKLRVDYVLPSADLMIRAAKLMAADPKASRHVPVIVDIDWPPP